MSRRDERASKGMYEQQTAMLPCTIRQELVGKRFIVITEESTRRSGKNPSLENYSWKQGYIRACSVNDLNDKELQVLVEFDGVTWEYRQWIKVYEQTKAFFVEKTIVWAAKIFHSNNAHRSTISWPALIFEPLVDYLGLNKEPKHPVEYFGDKQLAFLKENEVALFKDCDESLKQVFCLNARVQEDLIGWQRLQKTQACLMNGAETLTGARVVVYRLELRQWYTGCITAHNLKTRELHVMDDNVLQTHPVHPALVQINLMANDEELHRILHGEQIKMLPTRRQRNTQIYFQAACSEQKSQGAGANWHMVRDLNASQVKLAWNRPSVVRTVSRGKPMFMPGQDLDQKTSPQSLPDQNCTPPNKETENTPGCHSTAKVKVHKPIPVVLKPSGTLPFPHYAGVPKPPKPSNSPILSSLSSTPSPIRARLTPSPVSGPHTTSPQPLRNQAKETSPQNSRNEASFNRTPSEHHSARGVAEIELGRAKNLDNYRPTQSTLSSMTSSRNSSAVDMPEKNKVNSKAVPTPVVSSPSPQLFLSNKTTEGGSHIRHSPGIVTPRKASPQNPPRTLVTETQSGENPVRNISPESPPSVSTERSPHSRNSVPGIVTQRKKSRGGSSTKASHTGKETHPTVVLDDSPNFSAQQRSTNNLQNNGVSSERGQSSRIEDVGMQTVGTQAAGTQAAGTQAVGTQAAGTQAASTQAASTQAVSTQSDCMQSGNTQACSHLRTIAKIQVEYLLFLETLVRFQHTMILEAINTINQTVSEEQFCFVSDFFCKLVEGNWNTENIFREASVTRQDMQRVEHQRHTSQGNACSPSRVVGCLPEEVKSRLRSAQEAVNREREQVLSVVMPELQKKGQQREWEILKQQLQQKHHEALHHGGIQYQNVQKTQPAPRKVESQNNLSKQPTQQQEDKEQREENLVSLSFDRSGEVEITNERPGKRTEKEEKDEPAQQTNRTQVHSPQVSAIQLPPQERNTPSSAMTRESLRTPAQHLEQLQPLLLQREQQQQRQHHLTVQRKMVDELFQIKDMEQKTIFIQQMVQALQSQKASSRDVMKSPPTISTNFASKTTENHLTKVQNKRSQFAVPHEANETSQAEQLVTTMVPPLSAEQLLSNLTTSPSKLTENLGIAPRIISEKSPTTGNAQVSRNSDILKPASELVAGKDISASGSTTALLDVISDTSLNAGSKKNKIGSAKSSVKSGNTQKRKTWCPPETDVIETAPKPKRQRKSTKKKVAPSQDIPPPACQADNKEISVMKSVPPGEALSLTKAAADRTAVIPVKANEEDFYPRRSDYQPRSITKGIGFVPINVPAVPEATSFASIAKSSVTSSAASHSLDVLASVSASLITKTAVQNEQGFTRPAVGSVIQSISGGNRLLADGNRQFADQTRQRNDERNRQPTNGIYTSTDTFRLGTDGLRISAHTTQTEEVGVDTDYRTVPDASRAYSEDNRSHVECKAKGNGSASEQFSEENRGTNVLHTKDSACGDVVLFGLAGKDDNIRRNDIATSPGQVVNDKAVDTNTLGLNASVNKPKKPRKERQKNAKTPKPGSIGPPTDMSLLYLITGELNIPGKKSDVVFPAPGEKFSATHDDDDVKEVGVVDQSVNEDNVKSIDVEMKETVEPSKAVESSLKSTHIPVRNLEVQDSCKPMDSTCAVISQGSQPLGDGRTLLSNKSTDEALAAKGKHKNKEMSGSRKTAKKESRNKSDENKSEKASEKKETEKKASEKKPKASRKNKKDKETKTAKKSSEIKPGTDEKSKEIDEKQPHEKSINNKLSHSSNDGDFGKISSRKFGEKAGVEASERSSAIVDLLAHETSRLGLSQNENDRTRMSATILVNNEFSNSKATLTSFDSNVKESKKSDNKTSESDKQASGILQDSLNNELDFSNEPIRNKENTENATTTGAKVDVTEVSKKPKSKTDTSKPQSKKSPNEKSKKKSSKDEKSTKTNKKSSKKSEKNDLKLNAVNATTVDSINEALQSAHNEEATVCGNTKPTAMMIVKPVSPVAGGNEQTSTVQEQGNEQITMETSPTELATTDVSLKENGIEKRRESIDKDIVFVNDQSVGDFVRDSMFADSLLSRKRKRCTSPQRNNSIASESSDVECGVPGENNETASIESNQITSKKSASRKSSDNGKKSDARKKKPKKQNAEDETNDASTVSMETDTSALDDSTKQGEKKDLAPEAKKKVKKPKEKKVREKAPKEEWVYFLQRGGCKALPAMPQCRECRNYETEEEAVLNKSCCRFDMFRRCRSKSTKLEMAGFSSSENAKGDDFLPWVAGEEISKFLSLEVSKYILLNVGDEFCNLVNKEEEAFSWEAKKDTVAWKRAVRGIREMCDACATTIFNVHWVCPKCGFGVCLDCFKTRMNMSVTPAEAGRAKRFLWVRCSGNTSHRPQRLVLSHIIPKKTLHEISEQLHESREFWGIGKNCPCKKQREDSARIQEDSARIQEDGARIQELPDEYQKPVSDVIAGNSCLLENEQDKIEPTKSLEQTPMEIECEKMIENTKQETSEDTNEKIVKTEIENSVVSVLADSQSDHTVNMLPECEASATPACRAETHEKVDEVQKCQIDNSLEVEKASECKARTLSQQDNLSMCEANKPLSNKVDKPPECEVNKLPNSEEDNSSNVRVVGNGIGALSLLMDYESPVSSPVMSPLTDMTFVEGSEISSAEDVLLSRPHTTVGESSAMVSTSSQTIVDAVTGTSSGTSALSSEATSESSVNTGTYSGGASETSTLVGDPSEMTGDSSEMTGDSSAKTGDSVASLGSREREEINARISSRVTDELPAPHTWICRRPMLRLHNAHHEGNLKAFQSRWEKGEPVLVSGVHKQMTSHLWTPEGFENEFGSELADVVNCKTGGTLERLDIGTFWRGFESVKDRPVDNKGEPTLLKLKDWPPEADFVEKMPTRFKDLMAALPLPEYTSRDGSRNLVARLPDFFVKPDLGPKMYNAYGNAAFPSAGTTNLHIDMSDAVNVMVYVGVPFDKEYGEQERRDSLACIEVACDEVQQHRTRERTEKLGALWHIFAAEDANKIRALFHKVASEKNMKYPTSHDPIHDQCFYLDEPLLKRLKDEYGVVGWPIAQFLGDAIFIPAGAPHQVRNLHSCVKAAEDFVSPEHVGHCFKLTEEFRHLSEKHTNHEDKLQVKNIIYHAVKDAVSVLRQREHEITSRTEESVNQNV